jgi:predicted PurR-regulated permease PerM
MSDKPLSVHITPGTILSAVGIGLLLWLLFFLKDLVLIILTAIVLASAVEPGVAWFMKYRLHRVVSVSLVYILALGSFFGIAYLFFPPLIEEMRGFVALLPHYLDTFNVNSLLSQGFTGLGDQVTAMPSAPAGTSSITNLLFEFQNIFTATGEGAFRALSGIFGGVISFILIIVLSFYFAVQETGVDDFLRIAVPVKHQEYALNLWKRSHHKIGLWMQGQLLLSLIMGVFVFLWLTIMGVPYALVLAFVAALAELIPIFGPIIAGAAAVAVALSAVSFSTTLFVLGGFLVLHQLEAHLIYPLVVKKVVGVPPLLVILALVAGAQLAGFLGILLSVPLAAALQEFVSDVQKSKARELARLKDK